MGTYHVRALLQLSEGRAEEYYKAGLREQVGKIRLCGLCDVDARRAESFPDIPFFTHYPSMLKTVRPDMVVIATPSAQHHTMAADALESGIHAFVEKPVTRTVDEWDDLAARAGRAGVRIMAGHVERYNPVAIRIKDLLSDNRTVVTGYHFLRCQPHDPRIPDDIVTDKAVHDLDLAMFLFGPVAQAEVLDFRQVQSHTREVAIRVQHSSGVCGELHLSWLVEENSRARQCVLRTGSGENLVGDFMAKRLRLGGQELDCRVPGWIKPDNNQVKDELADFVGYCLEPAINQPVVEPLLTSAAIRAGIGLISNLSREIQEKASRQIPDSRREKACFALA